MSGPGAAGRAEHALVPSPGRDIAVKQLTLHEATDNSKGLRIGNFVQIRDVVDEELESVWSGKKDAKAALDEAVKRGIPLVHGAALGWSGQLLTVLPGRTGCLRCLFEAPPATPQNALQSASQ